MALKELEARYATKRAKDYKLFDGEGLYLLVRPNGSKLWRFKYRFGAVPAARAASHLNHKPSASAGPAADHPHSGRGLRISCCSRPARRKAAFDPLRSLGVVPSLRPQLGEVAGGLAFEVAWKGWR